MMKILIAPDKFKGSLTAIQVCDAIKKGLSQSGMQSEIVTLPLADGGEGTLEALSSYQDFQRIEILVSNPFGDKIRTYYLYDDKHKVAFIELASASGLMLLDKSSRNVAKANTYGTGEQIKHSIDIGATQIFLTIGGSASNDAGTGILQALGFVFKDRDGKVLRPCGENLSCISSIEWPQSNEIFINTKFVVLCDVSNPLSGPDGAAYVYGPQKGADEKMVKLLDDGLRHFADLSTELTGKDLSRQPGAGAAGGTGFGLCTYLNAELKPGIQSIMEMLDFEAHLKDASVVISGEGKLDEQTLSGKVVSGVYEQCRKHRKDLILVAGHIAIPIQDIWKDVQAFSILEIANDKDDAMKHADVLLRKISKEKIAATIAKLHQYD